MIILDLNVEHMLTHVTVVLDIYEALQFPLLTSLCMIYKLNLEKL